MSDTISNDEMDGVLLSIRRLMRETRARTHLQEETSIPARRRAPHAERFVLSSEFRVDSAEILQLRPDQAVTTTPASAKEADTSRRKMRDLIAEITVLEEVLMQRLDQWETAETRPPKTVEPVRTAPTPRDDSAVKRPTARPVDGLALRALVSEIVREELKGVPLQRDNRSLRRLIRQEIRQALAEKTPA